MEPQTRADSEQLMPLFRNTRSYRESSTALRKTVNGSFQSDKDVITKNNSHKIIII